MERRISRRDVLGGGLVMGAAAGSLALGLPRGAAVSRELAPPAERKPFPISLNTSTLRGHKLPIQKVVEIASTAGYQGIEPWPDEIRRYTESGGKLRDLARQLEDSGLKVTGAIAFFRWMVDDDAERAKALDEAKRTMEQLAAIGASHVAAPPSGPVDGVDLLHAAERYRKLLEIGDTTGVIPAVEVWGFRKGLQRLGQAVLVALEARHPRACVLPDVYHLYKGGSGLSGIALLNPKLLGGFHLNDYPADPPRESIQDRHRVYPGDGVGPLVKLFQDLWSIGYRGTLSIELFNREYYKQEPLHVARTALEKTRALLRAAAR